MRTALALCALSVIVAYSVPHVARAKEPCFELTFDDGPRLSTTPLLLDELKKAHVCATFFVIGDEAKRHPEIVKREASECHAVGNHSMTHPEQRIGHMNERAVSAQFSEAETVITQIIGLAPTIARVPGCAKSRAISAALKGYRVYGCDIDPRDWERSHRNADYVARYVIEHAVPGKPIVMHDIRPTTVAAIPRIISALKARGGCFSRVPEQSGPFVAQSR